MKKFSSEKAPYLRSRTEEVNSTPRMMYDVVIALFPIIIFGWFVNGLFPFINGDITSVYYLFKPLINIICGSLFSVLFEGLYFYLFLKIRTFKELLSKVIYSYAVIPGLLLALVLPVYIPIYVILFGCFIANIVFKMLFGGLGHNIFNPALIGYVFCFAAFGNLITSALTEQVNILSNTLNITAGSTPLTHMNSLAHTIGNYKLNYDQIVKGFGNLYDLFLGFKPGALGESSGILCILAGLYLGFRKVINWRIPVFYLGTVFILSWIIALVNNIEGILGGIWFPTYNILTGGLLFGSIFMATEPVTTPKTPNGKIIYAISVGILTVLFRLISGPEGVSTAILFMCLFTPIIDKFASINRKPVINFKIIINYCLVGLLLLIVAAYTVYKTTNLG